MKALTVVFGGMAVMVVTTVCGAMFVYNLFYDASVGGWGTQAGVGIVEGLFGGAIGALVGVPIWVWLGYKVCRDKNAAIDDSTT